jgi:hypothetical protein
MMTGCHLRLVPAVDAVHDRPRPRFFAWAPFPIAGLMVIASLVALIAPSIYARETPAWAAQGIGQNWVSLLVVAPGLCVSGALALRGSRRARLVAGALLLYAAYVSAVFAVGMHFNGLFLVHCAVLAGATFALIDLFAALQDDRAWLWFDDRAPLRASAVALLGLAGAFALVWLARVVPASLAGEAPAVNPVHVSIMLPAMAVVAIGLLRRRARVRMFAPVLLGFGALVALAVGTMTGVMALRDLSIDLVPAIALGGAAVVCGAILAILLLRVSEPKSSWAR